MVPDAAHKGYRASLKFANLRKTLRDREKRISFLKSGYEDLLGKAYCGRTSKIMHTSVIILVKLKAPMQINPSRKENYRLSFMHRTKR